MCIRENGIIVACGNEGINVNGHCRPAIAPLLFLLFSYSLFCNSDAFALSSGNVAGIYNASETATVTLTAMGESETEVFTGTNNNILITQNGSQFSFTVTDPSSGISVTRTGTVSGNSISNITGPIMAFRPTPGLIVNENRITSSSGQIYSDRFEIHVVGYATGSLDGVPGRFDVVSDAVFYSTAPIVTTGAASAITSTSATLGGTVNPQGYTTTARFEYGLTTTYGSSASVTLSPSNGYTAQTVSATVNGLQPGKTYHYRLTATSSRGSSSGNDATFTLNKNLALTLSGNGGGAVYGTKGTDSVIDCLYPPQQGACTASLAGGSVVKLTATRDSNSVFGGWGSQCGGCNGISCVVTVNDNKNCTAVFNEADRVRILTTPYLTLTSAFAKAASGEIRARAILFPENLNVSLPAEFRGGFNVEFTSNSGNFTTLKGTLTIGDGSLTVEGLIIAP